MIDNSADRLHEVFFYGLFMDPEILAGKGVEARNPRVASLANFRLQLGLPGSLLRSPGSVSYGILYSLTREELTTLYENPMFENYKPEAVTVQVGDQFQPALSYHLTIPPDENGSNPEYEANLIEAKNRLDVPRNTD